jgi:hypothetical protein
MTLPSSGQISFGDIDNEIGAANQSLSMSWLDTVTKTSVGGSVVALNDLNDLHGLTYYQNNVWNANCNNGNAYSTPNCNCGDQNCNNCVNCNAINCSGGDSQAYLQPNCNCYQTNGLNCTFNCTTNTVSFNCNCNCTFCACACW